MNSEFLERIGLTHTESLVYLALFKLGACKAYDIIRETNLHKSRVYDSLDRLLEKGLIGSVMHEQVKHFAVLDPEHLLDFVEERKKELDGLRLEAKKKLPELVALRELDSQKPFAEAQVLFGVEGFKSMRRDLLKHSKGEHLMMGAISREPKVMPVFFNWFERERIRQKIFQRILLQKGYDKPLPKKRLVEFRSLPSEITVPAVINVYGDRVVNVLWKKDYPLCFMLVNKDIADAYRSYFDLLWKTSSKV
ncbi:MAG: helix-turn-helix domain-containing protein [Candidatus Diapherotrites archaeon]|nr:helix-turn-helix domain-containing protein [Candidatus Diapherotrites archaeon]